MGVKWTEVCTTDRFGKSAEQVHSSGPEGNKGINCNGGIKD